MRSGKRTIKWESLQMNTVWEARAKRLITIWSARLPRRKQHGNAMVATRSARFAFCATSLDVHTRGWIGAENENKPFSMGKLYVAKPFGLSCTVISAFSCQLEKKNKCPAGPCVFPPISRLHMIKARRVHGVRILSSESIHEKCPAKCVWHGSLAEFQERKSTPFIGQ